MKNQDIDGSQKQKERMQMSLETPTVEDAPKIPHEPGTFCYHLQPNKENINYEKQKGTTTQSSRVPVFH